MIKKTIIAFLLICFNGLSQLEALELYTIFHQQCRHATGLIINVNNDHIFLLDTEGNLETVPREGVEQILVFNTLDNPVAALNMGGELGEYARHVNVQGDRDNNFIGWPIRFLEDLIVFYDIEGKIHLVDVDSIQGFEIPDKTQFGTIPIKQHKLYHFGFGNNLPECESGTQEGKDIIQPTRMISDPITISKFLKIYKDGFTKLDRFQKRTTFYARPYLYEKKTKVGIVVDREDYREELPALLPLNFQWPTGSNYGPQGILNLGSNVNLNLPNVEPVFAVNFAGKYHFLSVFFSGNVRGFSYGEAFIIENRSFYEEYFSRKDSEDILVFPQYNQLAMTGLEWGPYSFSGGYYYPIIGMKANGLFREILSEQSMPVVSLKYTTENTRWQLLASNITIQNDGPSDQNIRLIYANEMAQTTTISQASKDLASQIETIDLSSQFLRINFDLDLAKDISCGISEVLFQGDYSERLSGEDYQLKYRHFVTSVRLQQEFGDYVSLKGYLNYFIRQYQSKASDHDKDLEQNKLSFTVVVEFIL